MEQVNPNALGAPAEGFGQTVSFAFDPRGEVPQQQPASAGRQSGVNVSGLSNPRLSNPASAYSEVKTDPTAALLMKVADDILKKKLDEQRTVKFVEGMQAAMSGEAMTDIVNATPWYGKLFGDTPAIEGARAYTAAAKVNESVAAQATNMQELQKLGPQEAAQHFAKVVNSNLTGDGGTDTVIMKGMIEQMPGLMKAQAKAHYGYNQGVAMKALSKNMTSGAETLQAYGELHADDKLSAEDMKIETDKYIASVQFPEGIDDENGTKVLVANMQGMAMRGQFHAVQAIKLSGAYLAMSPEQANRVDSAIATAATKHRDNYTLTFAREIAEIKSHPTDGMTPAAINARIDAMSTKYQRLTGSPVALFSGDQKVDMLSGAFNAIKASQQRVAAAEETLRDKDAKEAEKEAAAAALQGEVRALIATGDFPLLGLKAGVTTDMIHRNVLEMSAADPVAGGNLLANGWLKGSYVNPVIQQQMQERMRRTEGSEVPTDEWFESVDLFNKMKASTGGLPYAQAYFGEDYAKKLQTASSMLGDNVLDHPQSARIFQMTMGGTQEARKVPLDAKETKALMKDVASLNSNALVRKFTGKFPMREDTLAIVGNLAQESTENWRGAGMSDSEAVAMGLSSAVSSGRLEIIGGYGIRNMDGRKDGKPPVSLRELASTPAQHIPPDAADAYFEGFLQEAKGIPTDGTTQLLRMGESGGNHKYRVSSQKDGVMQGVWEFTSTEWQAYAAARNKQDTGAYQPKYKGDHKWAFGPALTYPRQGTQSIYAHAAKGRAEVIDNMRNKTVKGASLYQEAASRAREQAEIAKRHQLKP